MGQYDRLIEKMYEFERRNGKAATAIYLGYVTKSDLFAEVAPMLVTRGRLAGSRPEINSIPIYTVDADHHMEVS